MRLTVFERRALERVVKCGPGAAVEINSNLRSSGTDQLRKMVGRGLIIISETARSGFEVLRGEFVSVTDKGREALSQS